MPLLITPEQATEEILNAVKAKAIALWGEERWLVDLTRRCNELFEESGDSIQAFRLRRAHIGRIFKNQNCTIPWLYKLVTSVNAKIHIL